MKDSRDLAAVRQVSAGEALRLIPADGVIVLDHDENHHLQRAVEGRTVTGRATGILMHRHQLSADQTFGLLRRHPEEHNRKVRDVAETITHTGELTT